MAQPNSRLLELETAALIDLYELDLNPLGENELVRFCNYADTGGASVSLDGNEYLPIPIIGSDFGQNINSSDEQPKLAIADVAKVVSAVLADFDDELAGAVIRRTRIYADNLDGGRDPDASAIFPVQRFVIENHQTDSMIFTFFLGSTFDLANLMIPRRRIREILDANNA